MTVDLDRLEWLFLREGLRDIVTEELNAYDPELVRRERDRYRSEHPERFHYVDVTQHGDGDPEKARITGHLLTREGRRRYDKIKRKYE